MDDRIVARYWEQNAAAWTDLSRRGYDRYRDLINTPAFFAMLGDVKGLRGLDVGCGEGHNTRLAAERGAQMTAFDIAPTFIQHAKHQESETPLGVEYIVASGTRVPFSDATFDFVMATMSYMDMPEPETAIAEAWRVLRPGGFIQFSVSHPVLMNPRWAWVRDEGGEKIGAVVGDYWHHMTGDIDTWTFGAAPQALKEQYDAFQVPRFSRTLSDWMNMVVDTGFVLEQIQEPRPDEAVIEQHPEVADAALAPFFLQIRGRKPS